MSARSYRVCTPIRWIVDTNAWHIIIESKGIILIWELQPNVTPFVQWAEA